MTAATSDAAGGEALAAVHKVVRRYEPLLIALAVCLAVLHLVDPISFQLPGAVGLAPFSGSSSGTAHPETGSPPAPEDLVATGQASGDPLAPVAVPPGAVVIDGGGTSTADDVSSGDTTTAADTTPPPTPAGPAPEGASVSVFARHPGAGGAGGVAVVGDRVVATLADGDAGLAVLSDGGELQRTIALPATGLAGVVARGDREVLVAATNPASIVAVDVETGEARPLSTIPDVGPCIPLIRETGCDASPLDAAAKPWALAEGPGGVVFVVDAGQGAIWRIPGDGGDAEQWLVDRTFVAPDGSAGPVGVAFDEAAGDLVVALPRRLTSDRGEVLAIDITPDGKAGAQRTVAQLADGQHVAGLALDGDGAILVSVPASRELVVLGGDGKERSRTAIGADVGAGDLAGISLVDDDAALLALRRVAATDATSIVRVEGIRGGT